ncbi:GNAT family N-acetyltransferase [Brevundimonas sp.]|uniref:GNAT family N-acetyltransferase n=1 Tax=Brevundimonas sp. TaxID=1871086 RepID=UPI003BAAA2B0
MTVEIHEVGEAQTSETWPVMQQLRPHLDLVSYLDAVNRMRRTDGFRLIAARTKGVIRGVAGIRVIEMLYCGRILVVDDLITDAGARSGGVGRAMLTWLGAEAARLGCGQIHLDSGLHRIDAHRFYEREGFQKTAWHFARAVRT